MMPYSKINIGDIFESPLKGIGSNISYIVVDKTEGLIEVELSYQHPSLPRTLWKKSTDRIFTRQIFIGK